MASRQLLGLASMHELPISPSLGARPGPPGCTELTAVRMFRLVLTRSCCSSWLCLDRVRRSEDSAEIHERLRWRQPADGIVASTHGGTEAIVADLRVDGRFFCSRR